MDNQQPVDPSQQVPVVSVQPPPQLIAPEPVVSGPVVPQSTAPSPVGGAHKEFAPQVRTVEAPVAEYVKPAEVAPTIPQEVAEAGVEATADIEHPQLDQTHAQAGIEHAPQAQPVVPSTTPVTLPYTYEQAEQIQKTTSINESKHWLVALTKYIMRKMQLHS